MDVGGSEMTDDYLTKLIDAHWEYVEGILRAHRLEDPDINLAKFHYKTAFKHGYKHAREDADAEQSHEVTTRDVDIQDLYP